MTMRSSFLAVPVIGLLLAFFSPFEPAKPGIKKKKRGTAPPVATVGGPWSKPGVLQRRFEEALAWTKAATRSDFVAPPAAQVSRAEDVSGFLLADMGAAFKKLGAKDEAQAETMSRALAAQLLAAYDPATNTIHVLSENARKAAAAAGNESLASEEVLHLVLVRMATIAMNRQLYTEWKEALDAAPSLDALHVAGAVMEGHAQYIAKRVTGERVRRGEFSAESFDNLVTLLTAPSDDPAGAAFSGEAKFALIKGQDFMALAAKRRRVATVLKQPPTDRKAILDPAAYFARGSKGTAGGLPGKVIGEFAELLPSDGGWKRDEQDHGAEKSERLLEPIEKQLYSAIMASFRSGKAWVATNEDSGCHRVVFLLEFRGAGMAEQFVNTAKSALKRKGGTTEDGAGRDQGLPGYVGTLETEHEGTKRTDVMQVTHEGRFVLGYIAGNDTEADREKQDDALEAAAEVLAKAQKTRKNRRDK